MSPRICHLTTVHPIDDVRIFVKECTSLAANGFDVTLIACGDTAFEDTRNQVRRISLYSPVKNRLQRFIYNSRVIYKKSLQIDADIYHFHDPELMPLGLKLKKRSKIVIYDVHEDYPLNIQTKEWIPCVFRQSIAKFMCYYERFAARRYDAIISVTPQIVERFKKINNDSYLITNYPVFNHSRTQAEFEKKVSNTFCYAGSITPLRLIHSIIKAMETIPDVKFLLAGEITNNYLNRLKRLNSWKNVIYLGQIPHHKVLSLYSKSDFGIIIEDYHPLNYYNEGSLGITKLFEFMQAGLPIICSDFTFYKMIIDTYNCGIAVNPTNIEEIATAIRYLFNNPEEARKMGINGQKAVNQTYNWNTQANKLIEIYNKLIKR